MHTCEVTIINPIPQAREGRSESGQAATVGHLTSGSVSQHFVSIPQDHLCWSPGRVRPRRSWDREGDRRMWGLLPSAGAIRGPGWTRSGEASPQPLAAHPHYLIRVCGHRGPGGSSPRTFIYLSDSSSPPWASTVSCPVLCTTGNE